MMEAAINFHAGTIDVPDCGDLLSTLAAAIAAALQGNLLGAELLAGATLPAARIESNAPD